MEAASATKRSLKAKKPVAPPTKPVTTQKDDKARASQPELNDNTILQEFLASATVAEYPNKHADITKLHNLICQHAPNLAPELQGKATLAYGGFDYQTKSKCSGRWSRISIMVNKTGLSLMVSGEKDGGYLLESYPKKHFGKASIGKSCVRFQKLSDLEVEHVKELISEAAKSKVSSIAVS